MKWLGLNRITFTYVFAQSVFAPRPGNYKIKERLEP